MTKLSREQLGAINRHFIERDATERLASDGWSRFEEPEWRGLGVAAGHPITLRRPLDNGFFGVLRLTGHGAVTETDGSIVAGQLHHRRSFSWGNYELLQIRIVALVEFEPAARVLRLIGDVHNARLRVDLEEFLPPGHDATIDVNTEADINAAVEKLVGLIAAVVLPALAANCSVDTLLETWAEVPATRRSQRWLVPVTLAALGQFDEARDALGIWTASFGESGPDWLTRRSIRQLNRYLDAGGALSEPPSPPAPRAQRRERVTDRNRRTRRRQAVEKVRRDTASFDRSERRRRLLEELAARDLSESPQFIERTLDGLEESPASRSWVERQVQSARALAKLTGQVGGIVAEIRRFAKSDDKVNSRLPAWLEPPEHAGYPAISPSAARPDLWEAMSAQVDGDWVEVCTDRGASAPLSRAFAAAPRRFAGTAVLPAWLDWDTPGGATIRDADGNDFPNRVDETRRLSVHLGAERIGHLNEEPSVRFRGAMQRAAHFDELPWVICRITSLRADGVFLLEVAAPPD